MGVDRCICTEQSFADLKRVASANGLTFDGLVLRTGCCTGCAMCGPYVRLMLRTGRTDFPPMSDEQLRALGVLPGSEGNEKPRP